MCRVRSRTERPGVRVHDLKFEFDKNSNGSHIKEDYSELATKIFNE